MRKFSSYGPVDKTLHYYAPRQALIEATQQQLLGENPDNGGHYLTVWGSRQTGKTWVMQQILAEFRDNPTYSSCFAVAKLNLQHLKEEAESLTIIQVLREELGYALQLELPTITNLRDFQHLFRREVLTKPLILILDEFDALSSKIIGDLVNVFRNIYIQRQDQSNKISAEKDYLLHGLALIGVRAVLGMENVAGSPFNIQRSLPIPNLTAEEVTGMFEWYARESGQSFAAGVIDRIYTEFRGQPGLTCWFGELLTEMYNQHNPTITMQDFEASFYAATNRLPNNNILNIISKAKQESYKHVIFEMFKTDKKQPFRYDDTSTNFLYLNGVVTEEIVTPTESYMKFPNPFVQKRLFNYFAYELFGEMGRLFDPFESLADVFAPSGLNLKALLRRYELYLQQNRHWLLKDAPRRYDLRIYEAVYHFNLYMYLKQFFQLKKGQVYPEFPTGNGKIDLMIHYEGQLYGIEVKSFTDQSSYNESLQQAAGYGQQLGLTEITLAIFVERVDEANQAKYEVVYQDITTGVTVIPVLVQTEL
jgi:hypothetical protein